MEERDGGKKAAGSSAPGRRRPAICLPRPRGGPRSGGRFPTRRSRNYFKWGADRTGCIPAGNRPRRAGHSHSPREGRAGAPSARLRRSLPSGRGAPPAARSLPGAQRGGGPGPSTPRAPLPLSVRRAGGGAAEEVRRAVPAPGRSSAAAGAERE